MMTFNPRSFKAAFIAIILLSLLFLAQSSEVLAYSALAAGAAPGDEHWLGNFTLNGVDNEIHALAAYQNGQVCAGGDFLVAGNVNAKHVACWNGMQWRALGNGVSLSGGINGYVLALAADGDNLYAGGNFETAGEVDAPLIAKWDGSAWSAMGELDGLVNALVVDGSHNLVAGGYFDTADSISVNFIARWDGSWHPLGVGMDGTVFALALDGETLYAAGSFTTAGGISANRIARWDGSTWSPLGGGLSGPVNALAVDASHNLYAGGEFVMAGGASAFRIARWDGSNWHALGSGVDDSVFGLAVDASGLVATGNFNTAGGKTVYRVARWDGSQWQNLANGLGGSGRALVAMGGKVYVGGSFWSDEAAAVSTRNIALWSGNAWHPLWSDSTVNDSIHAMASQGKDLFVSGDYITWAGGQPAVGIVRYDGQWHSLGEGTYGEIYALAANAGSLYAGGGFGNIGGIPANHIARWDGSAWHPLGAGLDNYIKALVLDGSTLYAAGNPIGSSSPVYRWDGSSWSQLGEDFNGTILALVVDKNGVLYAGGEFTAAGATPLNHVTRWDGAAWQPLGSGMNASVEVLLAAPNGDLYAGGMFGTAGGVAVLKVARWDGSNWNALGSGVTGYTCSPNVKALAMDDQGNLYVGGEFDYAGAVLANHIAMWDGSNWHALGSGIEGGNAVVFALQWHNGSLFVGGNFHQAGGRPSYYLARWYPGEIKQLFTYVPLVFK